MRHYRKTPLLSLLNAFYALCAMLYILLLNGCGQTSQVTDITGTDATVIGVLLPLTGDKSEKGQEVFKGIEAAYYREKPKNVNLLVRDTKADPSKTRELLKSMPFAKVVLGPLYADELKNVSHERAADQILISFSNDISQADGANIIMGINPNDEVAFMVKKAHASGMQRFAALLPDTEYGRRIEKVFTEELADVGAELVRVSYYSNTNYDVYGAVAALRDSAIDAILVPEGGKRLGVLFRELKRNKVQGRLLGLSLWDENLPKGVRLNGSWYAMPLSPNRSWFRTFYYNLYNKTPSTQAMLGFDAMSLLVTLLKRDPVAPFQWDNFTIDRGFQGVSGEFEVMDNGLVNRRMTILEISDSAPVVVAEEEGF